MKLRVHEDGSQEWLDPKYSEADVVHALVHVLKTLGIATVAELQVELPPVLVTKGRTLRADLAVMQGSTVVGLIEVKRQKRANRHVRFSGQAAKYVWAKIPWTYCEGYEDIERTVGWAQAILSRFDVPSIAEVMEA